MIYQLRDLEITPILIGHPGDNVLPTVPINVAPLEKKWPGSTIAIMAVRPNNDILYMPDVVQENGVLTWIVHRGDVQFVGSGSYQIVVSRNGDEMWHSNVYEFRVGDGLGDNTEDIPEPAAIWADRVLAAADKAYSSLRELEEKIATGQFKGEKGDAGERGPQGEQGIQGETGPMGPAGPRGEKGEKGDTGERGPQGEQGPQGLRGLKGDKGDTGERGEQGPQGVQGPQGLRGLKGDTGERGPQGPKGEQGLQGIQGPRGLKGDTGERGPQGEQGVKGDTGDPGPQGEQGPVGPAGADYDDTELVQKIQNMTQDIVRVDDDGSTEILVPTWEEFNEVKENKADKSELPKNATATTTGLVMVQPGQGLQVDSSGLLKGINNTAQGMSSLGNTYVISKGTLNSLLSQPSTMPALADAEKIAAQKRIGIVTITQEEYNLITPDANTIYLIVG